MDSIISYEHKGVSFYDIAPVLENHFKKVVKELWWQIYTSNLQFDVIIGLESRGFIIGSAMSMVADRGFIMARKPGKLPGEVVSVKYEKEYSVAEGSPDELCVQKDSLKGKRVLIVDDIIATGGSAKAAVDLIKKSEGYVAGFACLLGIKEFEDAWPKNIPIYVLRKV